MTVIQTTLKSLAGRSADHLGVELAVYVSDRTVPEGALSPGEFERYAGLPTSTRKQGWLRGRYVLKRVLDELGLDTDTSRYLPPHPRWSLSHSADLAVAVGSACTCQRGIGVDLELDNVPSAVAAGFFLDEHELEALHALPGAQAATVLKRLWSIKEAAFKATPHNRGTGLQHYRVLDIQAPEGKVTPRNKPLMRCRYRCFDIAHRGRMGCVAFAVTY
jgi:4'-phosphopantetheinyl transferase EntD